MEEQIKRLVKWFAILLMIVVLLFSTIFTYVLVKIVTKYDKNINNITENVASIQRQMDEIQALLPTQDGAVSVIQGIPGPQGTTGAKGDTGATGSQGERGEKGEQGVKGDTGEQGPQGIPGKSGRDGRPAPILELCWVVEGVLGQRWQGTLDCEPIAGPR